MIFKHFTQRQVLIELRRLGEKYSSKILVLRVRKANKKENIRKAYDYLLKQMK
jgi:hypothetical protein